MSGARLQEIIIGSTERSKEIKKLEKLGLVRKIAPRLYTSSLNEAPEKIIRRNWYHLLSRMYPQALLSHRSALERMPTPDGHIYLTHTYTDNVSLPGLTLHFLKGPGPIIPGDDLFFGDLRVSGLARAYLENLQSSRRTAEMSKTITRQQLEEKIEAFLRMKGEAAVNRVRDEARKIAPELHMEKEWEALNQLITDLLGTGVSKNLVSPIARARVLGEPMDPDRINLLESVYEQLVAQEFPEYPELNNSLRSYRNFAFFESYFSNYIEGTEFTIEEAKEIVTSGTPMPARDEDSHDVLGTYEIVSNRKEMSVPPRTANEFLSLLRERHGILLRARTSKNPGQFKDRNNRAGTTEFVDWQLVTGTLKKGFEWYTMLRHPFAKASFMMFLVSEVHPFLDGNGRIARVMMNAEFSAAGLSKIIIPTVFRDDYMGALKKLTKQRDATAYIRMLSRAWQFSSTIQGENLEAMEQHLQESNAFLAPKDGYLKIIGA
jgi:hypothetical protein